MATISAVDSMYKNNKHINFTSEYSNVWYYNNEMMYRDT